jgi:hypothetical protein
MKKFISVILLAICSLSLTASSQAEEETQPQDDTSEVVEEKFDFGEWLEKNFTATTITTITSVLTMLAVVIKLASYAKSLTKEKNITTEQVKNEVVSILETTNKESVEKSINELIAPLEEEIGSITPVLNAFAKILALSQENTAESRIAILELIQELGNVSGKIVEKAKAEVEKQVEEETKSQEEKVETLTAIEEKNSMPVE